MKLFFKSLYETLIYRLFWLAYPVSLYFLYDNGQMISFYLTLIIVLLSVVFYFHTMQHNMKIIEVHVVQV